MPTLELQLRWRDKETGESGYITQAIDAKHPFWRYTRLGFRLDRVYSNAAEAAHQGHCVKSCIIFQDLLGAKSCKADQIFVRRNGIKFCRPMFMSDSKGFDHTYAWYFPKQKKYLITTEPYFPPGEDAIESCKSHGWVYYVMRRGVGMWCPDSTRLIVISPGKRGIPLAPVIEILESKMPVIEWWGKELV